jgi:hypothetical protein
MPEIATQTAPEVTVVPSAPPLPNSTGTSTCKTGNLSANNHEIQKTEQQEQIKTSWIGRDEGFATEITEARINPQLRLISVLEECQKLDKAISAHFRIMQKICKEKSLAQKYPKDFSASEEQAQLKKQSALVSRAKHLAEDFNLLHNSTQPNSQKDQEKIDYDLAAKAKRRIGLSAGLTMHNLAQSLKFALFVLFCFNLTTFLLTIIAITGQWFYSLMLAQAAGFIAVTAIKFVCNLFPKSSKAKLELENKFLTKDQHWLPSTVTNATSKRKTRRDQLEKAAEALEAFCTNMEQEDKEKIDYDTLTLLGNLRSGEVAISCIPELWLQIQDEKDAQPGVIAQLMSLFKAPFVWIIKALGLGPATTEKEMITTGDDPMTMPIAIPQPLNNGVDTNDETITFVIEALGHKEFISPEKSNPGAVSHNNHKDCPHASGNQNKSRM